MSHANPRIERMLRELRESPSPRLLEDLFVAIGVGIRFAAAPAQRLARATKVARSQVREWASAATQRIHMSLSSSGSEPDVLQPNAKESP
jgi:hypothetical protein